jgi:hypothetical protein
MIDSGMIDSGRPSDLQQRAWMLQWRNAASALARVRAAELAGTDSRVVAEQLDDATVAAIRRGPKGLSGLVEQQRIFHRQRAR